jgi:hypothetical protein
MACQLLPQKLAAPIITSDEPPIGTFAWRQREVERLLNQHKEDWLHVDDPLAEYHN